MMVTRRPEFTTDPCWGFETRKRSGGISNELFPLVIIIVVGKLDITRIIIDKGSSCDIFYSSLFEKKMGLERRNLIPYDDSDLQAFNGMATRS